MRKIMRSLSGVEAAKQIATRGLKGLRNFASIFKVDIAGVEVGVDQSLNQDSQIAENCNTIFLTYLVPLEMQHKQRERVDLAD